MRIDVHFGENYPISSFVYNSFIEVKFGKK